MKVILAIVSFVGVVAASASAFALSVGPVHTQHIVSVGVAHPTQTLQVQQAGLYSSASTNATTVLQ